MFLRLAAPLAILVLAMSACSSGSDIPDDQSVRPSKAPAGWTADTLEDLRFATPAAWEQGETKQLTKTLESTSWRAPEVAGISPAGVEVRIISTPQQKAEKAVKALAVNAMAQLQGGRIEPEAITWPHAETGFYIAYEATFGATVANPKKYVTRTAVFDLADGRQIQVTSVSLKGEQDTTPDRVISTLKLPTPKDS